MITDFVVHEAAKGRPALFTLGLKAYNLYCTFKGN